MNQAALKNDYSEIFKKNTQEASLLFLYYFSHALIVFTPIILAIALYSMISRGMPPYAWVIPVINALTLFSIAYRYRQVYRKQLPPFYWFNIIMALGPWFLLLTSLNNIYLYSGQYIGVFESIDGVIFIIMVCMLAFLPSYKLIVSLCCVYLGVMVLVVIAELNFAKPRIEYGLHPFSSWFVFYLFAVVCTLTTSKLIRSLLTNFTKEFVKKQRVLQELMTARSDFLNIISSAKLNLGLVLKDLEEEKKNISIIRLEADLLELERLIKSTK
jgi:hypothetical protein